MATAFLWLAAQSGMTGMLASSTVLETRRPGPARWSREQDNVSRIVPHRLPSASTDSQDDESPALDGFGIVVIDPQSLTRNCLIAAIKGATSPRTVFAAENAEEVRDLINGGERFDVVIFNLEDQALDGTRLAAAITPIQRVIASTPLILLSAITNQACLTAALKQGVHAYLSSDTPLVTLLDAIRLASSGWMLYPSFRHDDLPVYPVRSKPREDGATARLTPRQEQVLQCLATGMPNKSIAFELKMSESTVKAHIKEIMQRLGASNRTQVVALIGRGD